MKWWQKLLLAPLVPFAGAIVILWLMMDGDG